MSDWKEEVRKRLRGLKVSPVNEAEIIEELAQHLDDVYQRALRNGASEVEAKHAALREFTTDHSLLNELQRTQKHPPQASSVPGESRRLNVLADFLQDLRYAARILWKNPGFTAVAVIALALGIGANTAIFSVVNTVLLRPLPYKDPEQLVMVWEDASRQGYPRDTPAAANFVDWRDQNSVFSGMAAIADMNFNLTGVGDPERLKGRRVSASLFPLLGVDPQLGLKVLGFTLAVSLLTGLIFGLAPAIQALRMNQSETLKEGGRDSVTGRSGKRLRGLLVMAEVAVSLVLLIAAGLLINSFLRLRNIDPGFRVDNLLTMKIDLPEPKYEEFERRRAFYTELIQRVQSLAGVRSAAVTTNLPLYRQGNSISVRIEGRPDPPPGQQLIVVTRMISPGYFDTMSIPLLAGRQFTDNDSENSPNVVVVSETMARRFWPGEDAIGKRIAVGRVRSDADWIQVIGIVKDVRQFELNAEPRPQMYMSYRQVGFFAAEDLVVKTDVEPASMAAAVRKAVWEIDKDQPVSHIRTMEEILAASIARQRFSMLLLGVFAGVALLLAAVGIYGVMSYSVAQRTHEIGIRMALGAQTGAVLKLAVGYGMKLVIAGVVIGLVAAFMLTRLMSTLLYGVTPTDPATFALISLLLVTVAAIASYIPARRATKVDPLVALRYE